MRNILPQTELQVPLEVHNVTRCRNCGVDRKERLRLMSSQTIFGPDQKELRVIDHAETVTEEYTVHIAGRVMSGGTVIFEGETWLRSYQCCAACGAILSDYRVVAITVRDGYEDFFGERKPVAKSKTGNFLTFAVPVPEGSIWCSEDAKTNLVRS